MLAMPAAPVGAAPAQESVDRPKRGAGSALTFNKPVELTSFSPLRTAVGTAYSLARGGQPSDHEWSGEPSIEVDERGRIYITGTCCVAASSAVWYSKNGKTFKEMESPGHAREWGIGTEGDLAVDDEGRVFFTDTMIAGIMMSRWSEYGDKWDYTAPAAGIIPGFDDRPWLAWSEPALYQYINHVSHTEVYRSTDGGLTWRTEGPLTWEGNAFGQPFFPGHIAAHRKKGTLWVAGLVEKGSGSGTLASAVSSDQGKTFTEAVVTKPQRKGGFSPIFTGATAVDRAGNGYTTWSTYDSEGCDVYYAASTDQGKSWNRPVKVNTGSGCATFPWIEADGAGKVAVVWYETPTSKKATAARRFMRTLTEPRTIYGGLEIPLAAFQDEVPDDAPWFLHAAAVTKADTANPKVVGARVSTPTPLLLGPLRRELWDFQQVDVGPDGRMHITYAVKFKDTAPQTWYVSSKRGPKLVD